MTRTLAQLYDLAVAVARWASIVALVLLVALVAAAVAVRYFGLFGGALHWADEAARFTMIWLVMLGSVVALDRGAHLRVVLLPDTLSTGARRAVVVLANLCSVLFVVVLAWAGWRIAMRTMGQVSPALGVRMGLVYMAIPVAATLMSFQVLALSILRRPEKSAADQTF